MNQCAVIVLPIPANIPMPRFRLFQAVRVGDRPGQVVGLQFITPDSAPTRYIVSGWHYTISCNDAESQINPIETIAESEINL